MKDVVNWEGGGGGKNWSKLPTDSTKKLPTWGRGASKVKEKLPTSFMDGPLSVFHSKSIWTERRYLESAL